MNLYDALEMLPKLKAEYPNTLFMFRFGDYYEFLKADAVTAAPLLEITLTRASSDKSVELCGVPYHAVSNYIAKLVKSGYRVALIEDGTVKNAVTREVIKLVAPVTNDQEFKNKYGVSTAEIVAKYEPHSRWDSTAFGLAFAAAKGGNEHVPTDISFYNAVRRDFVQAYTGKKLKFPLEVQGELHLEPKPAKKLKYAGAMSLDKIRTEDQSRFTLRSILADNGQWVSTDGHILVIIKDDSIAKIDKVLYRIEKLSDTGLQPFPDALEKYIKENDGVIIDKYILSKDAPGMTFPNYEVVLPKTGFLETKEMPIQPLIDLANRAADVRKNIDLPSSKNVAIRFDFGDFSLDLDSRYVFNCLQALQANGADFVTIIAKDNPNTPVQFETCAGHIALIMPLRDGGLPFVKVATPATPNKLRLQKVLKHLKTTPHPLEHLYKTPKTDWDTKRLAEIRRERQTEIKGIENILKAMQNNSQKSVIVS